MKRNFRVWLILASILALMIFTFIPVFADDMISDNLTTDEPITEETVIPEPTITPIPEDGMTDHLETAEDVRWYSFTLSEPGEGLIYLQSLQEVWTGYTFYWYTTVYASDMETVITETSVRGADHLTTFALEDLSAGTYYLKIQSVAYNNPLMADFTDDPYQITVHTFYHSTERTYEHDGVQIMSNADELICKLNTTFYIKLNDGEAFVALYRNQNNAIVPFLISETKEAVEYMVSDGTIVRAAPNPKIIDGTEYYYSNADSVPFHYFDKNACPFYFSSKAGPSDLINDVLERYEIDADGGEFLYFIKNYWGWLLVIGGFCLLMVGLVIKEKVSDLLYSRSSSSSRSSGGYNSSSGGSSSPTEQQLREMEDMRIVNHINQNLHTPGYDTESFGPDVETFPTDIDSFPPSSDM